MRSRATLVVLFAIIIIAIMPARLTAQAVTDTQVENWIELLQNRLLAEQRRDGTWQRPGYNVGVTSLVVMALTHAGMSADDPRLARALAFVTANSDYRVYSESLVACALSQIDGRKYRKRITEAARYLEKAQLDAGCWSYTLGGIGDNSNTQFAVLGLAAAESAGVRIDGAVKSSALEYWNRVQLSKGGYAYRQQGHATLSMTCAGIASQHLLGVPLEVPGDRCGDYDETRRQQRALRELTRLLKSRASKQLTPYALYALERVGLFLDLKQIGTIDWYRWGCERLPMMTGQYRLPSDLAFMLLFLSKGRAQIGIAKWQWSGDWNNDHADVREWVARGSKQFDGQLDWIPSPLERLDAPGTKASMVFVSGHQSFRGNAGEAEVLRAFLARGGTVVAEGCCNSKAFVDGFEKFVQTVLYPKLPVTFEPLSRTHPACRFVHALREEDVRGLVVKVGCRERRIVILERDISCALNGEASSAEERDRADKVAINLLGWAMKGKVAGGKLDRSDLSIEAEPDTSDLDDEPLFGDPTDAARRHERAFGRLVHRGDWTADASFFSSARKWLVEQRGYCPFDGEVFVNPLSKDLFTSAILYISGHDDPALRAHEWRQLRTYVERGGSILAVACCSATEFDAGFRRLIKQVFPNDELERVPTDASIFSTPTRLDSLRRDVTPGFAARFGDGLAPIYGIRREGRWVVLYSPADLCCDIEGDLTDDIPAYRKALALPLFGNLIEYLLSP